MQGKDIGADILHRYTIPVHTGASYSEGDDGKESRKWLKLARDVYKKRMLDLQEQMLVLQQKNTPTTSDTIQTGFI